MRSDVGVFSRKLLFMPDYDADPLWDTATEAMVSVDDLPITEATKKRVRAWGRRWDELATQDLSADYGDTPELAHKVVPAEVWAEHEREGLAAWRELQRDLGDEWRVGWVSFPDGRRHVQWEVDGPVELCLPGKAG